MNNTEVSSALLPLIAITASASDNASNMLVDEVARELANPNTVLTSLKFKTQYRTYTGDLPNADDQSGTIVLLQPTLPFPLDSGRTLWVRPGVNFIIDQPVYNIPQADFDSEAGLGDSSIDVQYGDTSKTGFLWSVGASTSIPTASEDKLGTDQWTLGPGFQLGAVTSSYVAVNLKSATLLNNESGF